MENVKRTRGAASARQEEQAEAPILTLPDSDFPYITSHILSCRGIRCLRYRSSLTNGYNILVLAMPRVPRTLAGHVGQGLTPAVSALSCSSPPFEGGTSMDASVQSGEGHPRCRRRRKRIGLRSILAGASVLLLVDINPTSNPRMTKLVIHLGYPRCQGEVRRLIESY